MNRGLLACFILVFPIFCSAQSSGIGLNQLGFVTDAGKAAVIPSCSAGEFWLVSAQSGGEVLRGPLSQCVTWPESGEQVKIADFSAFNKPGDYYLSVTGVGKSAVFTIADQQYDQAIKILSNAFYLNRAGIALEKSFAGEFTRPAGHPDLLVYRHPTAMDGHDKTDSILTSPRGWYDSGDYNKYSVNTAFTLYFLLRGLQNQKAIFEALNLNIPESSNRLPDILDEALWGLDWLLSMQDKDGGVYQQVSGLQSDLKGMPSQQVDARFVMQKNTASSLHFAAVMATASRTLAVYDKLLPGLAARYLQAADNAWNWAKKHPKVLYTQPAGVTGQIYAWTNDPLNDEWLWAAAELAQTTGKRSYLKGLDIPEKPRALQWQHVEVLALLSLLENKSTPSVQNKKIKETLINLGDEYVRQFWRSGYLVPLEGADFARESNYVAVNKAFTLIEMHRLFAKAEYVDAARGLLDYVLGRNPTGYSYVTGLGARSPSQPHHLLSQYDTIKRPLPGLLVSGPFALANDPCTYNSKLPAKRYLDDWCSEQTNSVSLAGTAGLLYVIVYLREGFSR